jgi:hypothetical protein
VLQPAPVPLPSGGLWPSARAWSPALRMNWQAKPSYLGSKWENSDVSTSAFWLSQLTSSSQIVADHWNKLNHLHFLRATFGDRSAVIAISETRIWDTLIPLQDDAFSTTIPQ